MILSRADLEHILENGLSDIDEANSYEVCAKVHLHFPTCEQCGFVLDLSEAIQSEAPACYREAADYLKRKGWKCEPKWSLDECDLRIWCPDCWLRRR